MAWPVIEVEIRWNLDNFKSVWNQAKILARDTKKELDKSLLVNLELNVVWIQRKLEDAKSKLRLAKKDLDKDAEISLRVETNKLTRDLTEAKRQLNNYVNTGNKELSRFKSNFNSLWTSLKSSLWWIASLLGWIVSVWKLTWLSDTFNSMQNALRQVSSWDELDILQKKILSVANNARVPIDDLTKAFVRFDLVNKKLWWTSDETLKILDTLSKWLTLSWASAWEVSSVMLQLSQAFWSGRLAWDEFRAVSESLPLVLDILAEKLWVPRWALKELASEWVITSEVLKSALIEANDKITEKFNNSQKTIGQTLTQIRNDFIIKFWEIDKAWWVTSGLINILENIKTSLLWFIEEFPILSWVVWAWTVSIWILWWAITLLWWPITAVIWWIALLVTWIGYLSSVIIDVQTQIWDLQTKLENNKIAQENLKKAYDLWLISLFQYNTESAKLITTQEDLIKKNEELQWSFSYLFTSIVAWVKSAYKIFVRVISASIVAVWEWIGNSIWFITENLKLIPYNFWVAFDNIPWAIEAWLKLALKSVWKFINAITLWLWWLVSEKLWLWKVIDDFNVFWSKKMQFKWVTLWLKDFKITKSIISETIEELENFWKIEVKPKIIPPTIPPQLPATTPTTIPQKVWKWSKWESAESKAEKEAENILNIKIKALEDEAKKNIEIINRSELKEKEKAEAIIAINKKLQNDLQDLKWDVIKTEERNAQEIIKIEEKKESERKKVVDSFYNSIDKSIDESTKKVQGYQKKIDSLQESFENLKTEAVKDIKVINENLEDLKIETQNKIAERQLKILEEQKETQKEINKLKSEWISQSLAESLWRDTLESLDIWWVKEISGQSISSLISYLDLLKKQKDLEKELKITKENTTDEVFNEIKRVNELSEAEKILEEQRKKTNVLEERKKINQAILDWEEILLDEIKNKENIKFAEWLIEKQTNIKNELAITQEWLAQEIELIKQMTNDKMNIEKQYSMFFKWEINKRIDDVKRLAQEMKNARIESQALQAGQVVNTNNTTNVWWVNVYNQTDWESAFNKLIP